MRELKNQFASALLVILAVAAVVSAFLNWQQNFVEGKRFLLPEDGVTWVDRTAPDGKNMVVALAVDPDSQAATAGITVGDVLLNIRNRPVQHAIDVAPILDEIRAWNRADYWVRRNGVEVNVSKVLIRAREPDYIVRYQYALGVAFLLIGLFVYFRRGNAPKSLHFLVLCLTNFVLSCFHYTGKLNTFDQVIYWGNVAAGLFAPTIFLHFCLTFPEARGIFRRGFVRTLLYLPAAVLLAILAGVALGNVRVAISPIELRWILDRVQVAFFSTVYLLGAVVLVAQQRHVEDPITRQQLKWLRNGAFAGILPYTLMYVIPFMIGVIPTKSMQLSILMLAIIPLTWAWGILRYRLMDVDVIFQQGYVYTLATVAVLGVFYGLFLTLGKVEDLSAPQIIALILVATFVFNPIRNWVQEQLDRYVFYKEHYDYRRTLIEFARELSSETSVETMMRSISDRLLQTLSLRQIAFFLRSECNDQDDPNFSLHAIYGKNGPVDPPDYLDLRFLPASPKEDYIFFERTRHSLDVVFREMPATVRHTIADLDLTYYLPCSVRGKTIAYVGISRTENGEFLSSDDLELLVTLSGSIGIAVENARLYESLQQKVAEYERLKEFSENIVESINVGVLAADLDDRVESWNNEIEKLTGIPRQLALGRTLRDLFPDELCDQFDEVRGETGIHNIYKFVLRSRPAAARVMQVANGTGANGNGAGALLNGTEWRPSEETREAIVNLAIAPLVSKEQKQIGRLIIFDDITDRSELERRLVQADKLSSIGLLAAGVAHEVNTPLAVISTYAQMLAKQVSGDDQKSKLLERIAKQTFRASEIVNSLLNFSRTSPAEFAEVDLNRVVHETVALVGHQLAKAHVDVKLDLTEELPVIKGNVGKLQQVFLNLVLNARDAMEHGGTLTIESRPVEDSVAVYVRDTGQGIPPEHLEKIYDPFFTTKTAKKGTGLGLSVTYGIVREHGGSIEVESELGVGTLFHLEFPAARKPVNA